MAESTSAPQPAINGQTAQPATNGQIPTPATNGHASFALGNFSIDEARPIKVIAIGAGYSGITAGIRFRQRVPNVDLTIYESNSGVGGAWFVNRYPGLACDIPSHAYQLTFEDNPNWSAFYAPGPEIRQYINDVVDKYALRPHIKLCHRIMRAAYNEETAKWHLTIRRPSKSTESVYWDWRNAKEGEYEEFEDTADVLFAGLGGLSRWAWPEIEGLETFKGTVVHSAQWETGEGEDQGWQESVKGWGEKNVGVIGVGSSAIQMVPALQPRVKHLTNYVRGKTWLSASFVKDRLVSLANREDVSNYTFTPEDKKNFADPTYYKNFRWELESELNAAHPATIRGSTLQIAAREVFEADMLKKLAKKPWIADHIIPDFAPACRRLTPGPGYLEALCEDNVDFVPTHIQKVTPTGIQTVDGKHQDLDVIVCATGFDTSFQFDFPILGRSGVNLNTQFSPHPRTYLSVTVDGFPNFFQCLGPNAGVGAGSLLILCERQVDYAVACTLKLQRERLKSMEVKKEAVDDFDEYLESYFPTTVFSEKCRSWYKAGKEEGRVVAIWPGSPLHAARALAHPRWEDYNYEPLDKVKNRFYWLGDGHAVADRDDAGDKAWYLKEVDYPPVPAK
ncbi:putative sterigmatocystin biosynthesis monooxygenase stcW [Hypsizygus marmoreus]|uniref:Sterigmatocystin biosynthesis monooxygenase stcW n=1 Tax=Hypsizygus marmoreus TaxID=39966 RepID=A0A369K3T4_HYPMA|nr:putative sterigmatocystin biosynthesis monooxygenase stcW [Hypsizygus marmoreus]